MREGGGREGGGGAFYKSHGIPLFYHFTSEETKMERKSSDLCIFHVSGRVRPQPRPTKCNFQALSFNKTMATSNRVRHLTLGYITPLSAATCSFIELIQSEDKGYTLSLS